MGYITIVQWKTTKFPFGRSGQALVVELNGVRQKIPAQYPVPCLRLFYRYLPDEPGKIYNKFVRQNTTGRSHFRKEMSFLIKDLLITSRLTSKKDNHRFYKRRHCFSRINAVF